MPNVKDNLFKINCFNQKLVDIGVDKQTRNFS